MRLLIADDEPGIVALLQAMLPADWPAETATNGEEALEKFSAALAEGRAYDLIFMDIMMPKKDGRTVLREIRRQEEAAGISWGDGVKVAMLSALHDHANVLGSFHHDGCDAYIDKPFTEESLWRVLTEFGFEF